MLLNLSLSVPYLGNGNNSYLEEICVLIILLNYTAYVNHLTRDCVAAESIPQILTRGSPFLSSLCSLLTYFSTSNIFSAIIMR